MGGKWSSRQGKGLECEKSKTSESFMSELNGDISHICLESYQTSVDFAEGHDKDKNKNKNRVEQDQAMPSSKFGDIFRSCAPYIALHRGKRMVLHISDEIISDQAKLDELMDDVSMLHLLGVRIVLVMGVRQLLHEKLRAAGKQPTYKQGLRITDRETLELLKEASGTARSEIERSLTRRTLGSGSSNVNVVSSNLFFSLKPVGVRNGTDFQFAGEIRKIEEGHITKYLEEDDIVLLSPLGYSPSGESFSVPSETLAAECAISIGANKVIFFTQGGRLVDRRNGRPITSLRYVCLYVCMYICVGLYVDMCIGIYERIRLCI